MDNQYFTNEMTEYEVEMEITWLQNQGKWKEIIDLGKSKTNFETRRLLWVWPSLDDLNWFKSVMKENKLKGIFSIGCGTGLLEWIIQKHSECHVIGVEADQPWWQSKYSPPIYLNKMLFMDRENSNLSIPPDFAVLFCYFNDGQAFNEYMKNYSGKFVFIIGPDEGQNRCTDPKPFDKKLPELGWQLSCWRKMDNNTDIITTYIRTM